MGPRLGIIDAFQETFDLCWGRLPALVRISWAPGLLLILAYIAILFFIVVPIAASMPAIPNGPDGKPDPKALEAAANHLFSQILPGFIAWSSAALLIVATMIGVPVSRLAGAAEEPEGIFFIRWSSRHTRFAIALVVQTILPYALWIAAIAGLMFAGHLEQLRQVAEQIGAGTVEPNSLVRAQSELDLVQFIELVSVLGVGVLLITLTPIAAIENRLRFFGALGTGLRHFFPILGGYVLLYLATLVLSIAVAAVFGIVLIVCFLAAGALQPVLGSSGTALINVLLAIASLVAFFVFQIFYVGLWFAYPAIVYRRLTA